MHGWNDPIDPEGATSRPVPPTGEPPYRPYGPTGHPTHQSASQDNYHSSGSSAYVGLPGPDDHHRRSATDDRYTSDYPGYPATGHHRYTSDYPTADDDRYDPGYPGSVDDQYRPGHLDGPAGAPQPPVADSRRHRSGRRFSRPTVAVGAAAVAALAVMVGAGAALMPTGTEQQPAVAEGAGAGLPVDPAPAGTDEPTTSPPGTPTATATPSTSPSPTAKPRPTATRSSAPARTVRRTAAPSPTRTTAPAGNKGTSSVEQQVVTLVNQERAKAGCGAVTVNANLATAAQLHSDDQAARQQMSHTGSDGSDFVQRAKRAGYQYPIGENVAMGYETAAAVMQGWMNSPGHRANILNCDARAIGVGVATGGGRLYWTQVFGSRA